MAIYHWRNFPEKNPILLWEKTPGFDPCIDQDEPSLTPYLCENTKGVMLVFPGGGYSMKASHEAEDIAQFYQAAGISSYVLNYRVAPYRHPWPLEDARRAIRWARHTHPGLPIAIIGFSAGGHLAGSAATLFGVEEREPQDAIDQESDRPDAAVLCYPVLGMDDERVHAGSRECLLGPGWTREQAMRLSIPERVTAATPPCFLWHTAADEAVPVTNSLTMALALKAQQVPFELHIFPEGHHGLGLAPDFPAVAPWAPLSVTFLRNLGF